MKFIPIFIFFLDFAFAQNIPLYLTLVEKGEIEEVRESLPNLLSRYPNDPGVYYLEALINLSGDESIAKYQRLINNYPKSEFAYLSSVKIGEYFFSRGLYSQASQQLKKTVLMYPKGNDHQRAIDLMVNSYNATGEDDSSKVILAYFKDIYPNLNYEKYGFNFDSTPREARLIKLDPNRISSRIKSIKESRKKIQPIEIRKPWVVQIGAFGRYENANRLKNQFQNNGYDAEIHPVYSNGNRLHAVRIVRFESKNSANNIGKSIKNKFGIDYRIINNPE